MFILKNNKNNVGDFMSFQSYIIFLIKNFNEQKQTKKQKPMSSLNHQWFGTLPFLLKWLSPSKKIKGMGQKAAKK